MEQASLWINQVSQAVGRALGQLVEFLPTLIGALVILAAGWLIARVVRSVGIRAAHWLNRFLDRCLGPDRARYLRVSNAGSSCSAM